MNEKQIGFIGQGFIGKHMADDFEARGHKIVRYSLEPEYINNKTNLVNCETVFIAVPTPTTPEGFSDEAVKDALSILPAGTTAVVKSTLLPGTTENLQKLFPKLYVLNSPEFLREKTADKDTASPERNIIGIPVDTTEYLRRADSVLSILPKAKHNIVTTARNAEFIKYIGNAFLYTKVVFMNIVHDLVIEGGGDWDIVQKTVAQDSRIGKSHMNVVHDSGRGAGGHCFIKDFEALLQYGDAALDGKSLEVLRALRNKNNDLLQKSNKDMDLLRGVYGE